MIGSLQRHAAREPGANPGRSRRCEGSCSPATTPLASGLGRRRGREPRVRRPAAHLQGTRPLAEGGIVHRVSLVLAAFAVALSVIPAARTERVHVRVEGKTQTVYGSTDPAMEVRKQQTHPPVTDLSPTPLDVLEAASLRGEFYYHVTV